MYAHALNIGIHPEAAHPYMKKKKRKKPGACQHPSFVGDRRFHYTALCVMEAEQRQRQQEKTAAGMRAD